MRSVYLNQLPRKRALALFLEKTSLPRREEILPVNEALGRITAQPVFAKQSMPAYHAAAMDGIAVIAEKTFGASDQLPIILNLGDDYYPVNTGDPIPQGFDAVIKIEDLQPLTEQSMEIIAPAAPWQHIRPVGEDVVAWELVLPALHKLGPVDLGAILAGGVTAINVLARPRVVVIPVGDELISPEETVKTGQIPEFNSTVIASFLTQWGATAEVFPIAKDSIKELVSQVKLACSQADIVIVNAGSSAGSKDFTSHVIQTAGELLVHGVATRPGKPSILGVVNRKPVIGLPGYPVSAYLALEWFIRPLIFRYYGQHEPQRPLIKAVTGRRIVSELGIEDFIRVTLGYINGRFMVNPLNRGAGVTMSLVKADGLLVVPADSRGFEQDEEVEVELFRSEPELKNTMVAVGSHDLALDLLGIALKKILPELNFSSSHVGSMAGITAIRNDQAHLAGVHLFDKNTGEYNIPFIKRFLPEKPVILVNLTYRIQGWIVLPGNPYKIQSVTDLLQAGLRFINRQRGAGTRMLFDFLLEQARIDPAQIYGYQREEYTHLNLAAAVAAGTADAGLGVYSAAKAYGLDFIPLAEERYDLLMSKEFYSSDLGKILFKIISAPDYQREIEGLGGYSLRDAGRVFYQQ